MYTVQMPSPAKEWINFSTHPGDTQRFNNDWSAVAAYVQGLGIDGLELLIGYDAPPQLPPELVGAVHLPFCLTWLDVWHNRAIIPPASAEFIHWIYGGRTAADLIATQRQVWQYAATLDPAYMVFHRDRAEFDTKLATQRAALRTV